MWILVTINTCILWVTIDYSYIRNGDDRETQLSSITTIGNSTLPMLIVSSVASFSSFLLTDLTMVCGATIISPVLLPVLSHPLDLEMLGAVWS